MTDSKVLIIYTGGTIGMREDPVDGALRPFNFDRLTRDVPELSKFALKIDTMQLDPLIDSSDVEPSLWVKLATIVRDNYHSYDGFVVLHGTDTMAYSASALSFMLEGLSKPVVFTGSQLPIGVPRTDGRENLISSVEIAASREADGSATVPEVCIFFGSELMRGNRTTKFSAESFDAFLRPNCPPLAKSGISIRYNRDVILKAQQGAQLSVNLDLDTRVSILKVHPGITQQIARLVLCSPGIRAVILETYGSGNAISKDWFTDIVKDAVAMGKIVLNVTQCGSGAVNMGLYATGRALKDSGVISGYDSTTEAALSKLFVLMGKTQDNQVVKTLLEDNLRGEISN